MVKSLGSTSSCTVTTACRRWGRACLADPTVVGAQPTGSQARTGMEPYRALNPQLQTSSAANQDLGVGGSEHRDQQQEQRYGMGRLPQWQTQRQQTIAVQQQHYAQNITGGWTYERQPMPVIQPDAYWSPLHFQPQPSAPSQAVWSRFATMDPAYVTPLTVAGAHATDSQFLPGTNPNEALDPQLQASSAANPDTGMDYSP